MNRTQTHTILIFGAFALLMAFLGFRGDGTYDPTIHKALFGVCASVVVCIWLIPQIVGRTLLVVGLYAGASTLLTAVASIAGLDGGNMLMRALAFPMSFASYSMSGEWQYGAGQGLGVLMISMFATYYGTALLRTREEDEEVDRQEHIAHAQHQRVHCASCGWKGTLARFEDQAGCPLCGSDLYIED